MTFVQQLFLITGQLDADHGTVLIRPVRQMTAMPKSHSLNCRCGYYDPSPSNTWEPIPFLNMRSDNPTENFGNVLIAQHFMNLGIEIRITNLKRRILVHVTFDGRSFVNPLMEIDPNRGQFPGGVVILPDPNGNVNSVLIPGFFQHAQDERGYYQYDEQGQPVMYFAQTGWVPQSQGLVERTGGASSPMMENELGKIRVDIFMADAGDPNGAFYLAPTMDGLRQNPNRPTRRMRGGNEDVIYKGGRGGLYGYEEGFETPATIGITEDAAISYGDTMKVDMPSVRAYRGPLLLTVEFQYNFLGNLPHMLREYFLNEQITGQNPDVPKASIRGKTVRESDQPGNRPSGFPLQKVGGDQGTRREFVDLSDLDIEGMLRRKQLTDSDDAPSYKGRHPGLMGPDDIPEVE